MMSLGSAIGTGLFLGSKESLIQTGPSVVLAYIITGIMMYIVVRALGEMAVHEPNSGSFSYYANKYVSPYVGFVSGWNYWFNYIIVSMLELTATSMLLELWFPHNVHWLVILTVFAIFGLFNLLSVKFFGEFEFWFAGVKVTTILIFIIFAVYLMFFNRGVSANVVHNYQNIVDNNLFFSHGLSGFLLSMVAVIFSFGGIELIGISAGESQDPEKNIPLAINGTVFRILFFYVFTMIIIVLMYSWADLAKPTSPFVDVFSDIGVAHAASIMNIVAITAALSSFNSGIYGTARMLFNLSLRGEAPKFLSSVNRNHVPAKAIYVSLLAIFIVVVLNYFFVTSIFDFLIALATIAAIINWLFILFTYIRFKAKVHKTTYNLPYYKFWISLASIFFIIVGCVMYQHVDMKFALIIGPVWLVLLSIIYLIKTMLRKVAHNV